MVGIASWGAYVPLLRLSRSAVVAANSWIAPGLQSKAKGERAMANWDEDALTMAVEAARDALGPDDDRSGVDALYFASTTAPFADRLNAGIVAAALTLEKRVQACDITGSQRAGLTALAQALEYSTVTGAKVLTVSGEHRHARAASPQELDFGDGAAAFVVANGNSVADFLGRGTVTEDFVDHFRPADGHFDYVWEERWVRDEGILKLVQPAIASALAAAGISASEVTHFCFPTVISGTAQALSKQIGIPAAAVRDTLSSRMGEAGAAHSLLMLGHALEDSAPGDIILVAQFAQGAEALVFRVTEQVRTSRPRCGVTNSLSQRKVETNYLKFLYFNELVEWDKGMRAEKDAKTALTTLYRNNDAILGLVGGRCRQSGVVQFPRSRISVAPGDPAIDTQEPYKFAERQAVVLSWSADFLSFSMSPPNHYGLIDFDGGGRIYLDITDVAQGEVTTGMKVRMTFRLKEIDERRGFRRYFWKAAPCRQLAPAQAQLSTA